jgi:Uma2 family endonuclease
MSRIAIPKLRSVARAEPTWEIARLFPDQGAWSEEEYLALNTNHLIEFSNGWLEVLPMPTDSHQVLMLYLYGLLSELALRQSLGQVRVAALPVRLWRRKFREPDVLFMLKKHEARITNDFWIGADLVMEVVSPGAESRRRDLRIKPLEYARAHIPEYWIVNPEAQQVTVLRLARTRYGVHGVFTLGSVAVSHLLPEFRVDVSEMFGKVRMMGAANRSSNARRKRDRR